MTRKQSTDTSELKKLKARIKQLEDENLSLREINLLTPGHLYWKDKNGRLLGCNDEQAKAAKLTSPSDIQGLKPIDLINKNQPEKDRIKQAKAIEKIDKQVLSENRTVSVEETAVLDDGSVGYFLSKKSPLHDQAGRVKGLVGITLDITPLKQLRHKLELANQNKSNIMLSIATLFRDTLSATTCMVDALKQTQLTNKQSRCTDILDRSIKNLLPRLEQLDHYVDLIDNKLPLIENTFNLKNVLGNIINEHESIVKSKGLVLSLDYAKEVPTWVTGCEYFISWIADHLIKNAIHYTHQGSVTVKARKPDQVVKGKFTLELTISDTGCGINQDAQKYLFDLFDINTADHTGDLLTKAGLNLSITSKMLEIMHGNISVSSKSNQGTAFTITLPLLKAKPLKQTKNTSLRLQDNSAEAPAFQPSDSIVRILILDNDPLWQSAMKIVLEDAFNCCIDQAHTHVDIKNIIKKEYDIIFMDLGLPNRSHLDFANQYRKKHGNETPIIVTTACVSDEQQEKINSLANITDIIGKPLSYHQITELVNYYVFQDASNIE